MFFYIFILTLLFLGFSVVFICFLLIQLFFNLFLFFGAPFVPSPMEKVEKMLKLANPKPGEILYDLGSGNGKILIEAVKQYQVKAVGIEINPFLVWFSRRKIRKLGLEDRIKIYQGNFFKKNLSDADIILIYLLQTTMNPLGEKLLSELKPGTRLVSLAFTFDKIPFVKSDSEYPSIRLYQIPEQNQSKNLRS